jgi:hypothetical protein
MNEAPQPPQVAAVDPVLDYQAIPRADPSDQSHDPSKPWRVGTLAYSTAGLVVLFAWLLWGDFAWSMKDRTVGDVVTLLIHKFDASDTLLTLMLVIVPQVIIIVVQPIISYKSDRHRGRWGRRIPFLLAPTPFAVLSMLGLAFCPFLGSFLTRGAGLSAPAGNVLRITTADGSAQDVSLAKARTFQEVVDEINRLGTDPNTKAAKFTAKFIGVKNELELTDNSKGSGILKVTPLGGSTIASDLGLTMPSSGGKIDGIATPALVKSIGRLDQSTLLFYALFWVTFEVATTVADSVYRGFVNDVVPRPVLGRFYGMFRALSLIAGMIFNEWFFGLSGTHYVAIFVGIGLLYGVGFSVMCFKVKEGQYPPPSELPRQASMPAQSSGARTVPKLAELEKDLAASRFAAIQSYFRDCFTHPYYFMVFAAIILPNLAFIPINTFNLYFAQSLGMTNGEFGHYKAIYFGISLLQTVPLGWLVDKYHPLRVSIVALILHGAASLWGGLFIHGTHTFALAYIATGTLSGTWFTATASMALVLMPKIKFAQYYSAMAAIQSLLVILFNLGAGKVLDLTHHMYRLTYLSGGIFDILGLISTIIVFRMFLKLGGTRAYVAP